MSTQSVDTLVIIATLIVSVLLFGLLGWRFLNAPLRDARGQDLSRAAVMPVSMTYARKPPAAKGARGGAMPGIGDEEEALTELPPHDRGIGGTPPMEDQNRPSRNLKGLWLLPILALGLGVLVSSWRKPASRQPTAFEAASRASQMRHDAYDQAKYHLLSQVMRGQPKGYTLIGFAPYKDGIVTGLGPARFRCSSSLSVRSQAGEVQTERWQCMITGSHYDWNCADFRHTPPERVRPNKAKPSETFADKR